MGNPGSNLLRMASRILQMQTVQYYRNTGRTNNAIGVLTPILEAPINLKGSFQVIARNKFEQYGLDLDRKYVTFHTQSDAIGVERDFSGDQFTIYGERFQVESTTPWFNIDGWTSILAVKILLGS